MEYSQVNLALKISGQEKMPLVEVPKTMPPYIATNPDSSSDSDRFLIFG